MSFCHPFCIETSTPVDGSGLVDAMQSFLAARMPSLPPNTLLGAMLMDDSRKRAIGWVSSQAAEDLLLSESLTHLRDTLSIRCTAARGSVCGHLYLALPADPAAAFAEPFLSALRVLAGSVEYTAFLRSHECVVLLARPLQLPPSLALCSVRPVVVPEMCIVRCIWAGTPSKDAHSLFALSRRSLLSLVQAALYLSGVDAAVVATCVLSAASASLLCATRADADLVQRNGALKLGALGHLVPSQLYTSGRPTGPTGGKAHPSAALEPKRQVYVFWNADDCPLLPEDDISSIDQALFRRLQSVDPAEAAAPIKIVFLSQDKAKGVCLSSAQIRILTSLDYKIIFNTGLMRAEIDAMIKKFAKTALKPWVVIVAGSTYDSLVSLKVEEFKHVLYVYNISPQMARAQPVDALAPHHVAWADLKSGTSCSTTAASVPKVRDIPNPAPISSCPPRTIELDKLSIALHLKNLIAWSACDESTVLHGERAHGDAGDTCVLKVKIDTKIKEYSLQLCGEGAAKRADRMDHVLEGLRGNRRVFKLVGWKAQHRDSITDSTLLSAEEQRLECTAVFHTPENRVIVECVAMSSKAIREFHAFVNSLTPCEDQWDVPHCDAKYFKSHEWSQFLSSFALSARVKSSGGFSTKISVWGFGALVEKARQQLLVSFSSADKEPLASKHMSESRRGAMGVASDHSTTLTFKEKEVGFYFLAFETEIESFLLRTYNVVVERVEQEPQTSSKKVFPPLRVELFGSVDSTDAAKAYLEGFSRNTMKKVFFPMVDAAKYKEICDVVATQKGLVREQRAKSKHFSSEDPYFSPGFVSIRVTPPMHNKGIRRMTLPADTTVILQSPISCDAQRVQLEAACAAVARITSGYAEASVEISSTSEFAQLMATKHFREDFAATQDLVGATWNPSPDGTTGVVKLWAANERSIKAATEAMLSTEHPPLMHSTVESESEREDTVVIRLPHPSLKYVLEAPEQRVVLNKVLSSFPSSVACVDSIFSSNNTESFVQLTGPCSYVTAAKIELRTFLESLASEIHSVQLSLSPHELQLLMADDLAPVKRIQSAYFVQIILFPDDDDLDSASSLTSDDASIALRSNTEYSAIVVNSADHSVEVSIEMGQPKRTMSSIVVKVKHSTDSYHAAFTSISNEDYATIEFSVELPDAIANKNEWLASSVIKALKSADSYGLIDVSISILSRTFENPESVDEYYRVIAFAVDECLRTTALPNINRILLLLDDAAYGESKCSDNQPFSLSPQTKKLQELQEMFVHSKHGPPATPPGFQADALSSASSPIILRGLQERIDDAKFEIFSLVKSVNK